MATLNEIIRENWDGIRQAIKERWGHRISDQELADIVPDHAALCDLIGDRCGFTKEQSRREVNRLLDAFQGRGGI